MCSDDNNAFYENPFVKIPLMVTGIWWIRNWFKGTQYRDPDRIDGKIAVVTGSSSGIGKCIAEELNRRGAKVYMLCRDREKSEKVIDELVQKGCDEERLILRIGNLCDFNSLKSFSEKFRQDERKLDILVNNASVIALPKFNKTIDEYEETWQANFLGHVVLTEMLLPQLKASESARIIMTGSRLHFFGDTISPEVANDPKHYGRLLPYNRAKLALTMYVRGLARRLQEDRVNNVTVNIFHPGMVNTPLYKTTPFKKPIISHILSPGAALIFKTPMDGAQTGIFLACSPKVEGVTGKYFDECQETRPASQVLDDQKVRQIFGYTRNVLKSLGI